MFSIFKTDVSYDMWDRAPKFKFWDEVKKPRNFLKPRLNLKHFWIAAVAALSMQTSVWAEMGSLSKYDVQLNNVGKYSIAEKVRASDYWGSFHNLNELTYHQTSSLAKNESTIFNSSVPFELDSEALGLADSSLHVREGSVDDTVQTSIERLLPCVKMLVGEGGVRRLVDFSQFSEGWNGVASYGLKKDSVKNFERFFGSTDFAPEDVAVFMSSGGNVVVNWLKNSNLTELEFTDSGLYYFLEARDSEGFVARNNFGDFKRLLKSA